MFRISTSLLLALISVPVLAQDKNDKPPSTRLELIFMETKKIEGVTQAEGFKYGEGGAIGYLHKKPALILTRDKVEKAELKNFDFSGSGLSANNYSVKVVLTEKARKELASKVKDKKMKLLTLLIDGKRWGGLWRYEVDESKRGVPPTARASTFQPTIGYFSSRSKAERIANALN